MGSGQTYDRVRLSIANGKLRAGDGLPSTQIFADEFNVARGTVGLLAYSLIVADSLLIRVKGTTLLRQAWNRKRPQVFRSLGNLSPRNLMIATRIAPAISVLAAINVTGGIVSTPILMKV
jgi:DNA-binding transcriptional regulator YhcF (GntR family)